MNQESKTAQNHAVVTTYEAIPGFGTCLRYGARFLPVERQIQIRGFPHSLFGAKEEEQSLGF